MYAVLAGGWIVFSDRASAFLWHDPSVLATVQTYKGVGFVIATAGVLFLSLRRQFRAWEEATAEREIAERGEREASERLRLFIEHAPVALAMFDRQMRYIAVSRRWMADYGLGAQHIVNCSHYDIFPEIPDRWKAVHRRGLAGEIVRAEEDRFDRADGTVQWLRWEVRPWTGADGAVGGIVIFTEEITQRKWDEEALRASELRFRLAASTGDVWEVDLLTGEGYIPPRFKRQLGYDDSEVENRVDAFEPLVHPEDRDRWRQAITDHLVRPAPYELEFRARAKSGEYRWFHTRGQAVWDETGRATYMAGTTFDITERKRAEEALRESEARYRQLLEVSPVGVAVHSEGKLVFTNPAGARLLGAASPEQLIGRTIAEVVHPDGLKAAEERIQRMLAGEPGLYPTEDRYVRLDGAVIPVEVMAAPLTYQEKPSVQVMVTDITERKRAEEEIRRLNVGLEQRVSERTEELNRMVRLMAGREVRMAELKGVIGQLRAQIQEAGLTPVEDDPLRRTKGSGER
jgi:PAS domain S-box-containing protein